MKQLLATLVMVVGFAGVALAQEAAEEHAKGDALPKFTDIDKNEDGKIDQSEARVLAETLKESEMEFDFRTADANEDGAIDAVEYAQYQAKLRA